MYAHVNIWHLNEAGDSPSDAAAQELAARLSAQPGFRSYTLIRTGEREVVAVTIFDSAGQLTAALEQAAGLVRERIDPLAAGPPERRRGEVVYMVTAGDVAEGR
jgi:heme-degrading monooxygenase HmoA